MQTCQHRDVIPAVLWLCLLLLSSAVVAQIEEEDLDEPELASIDEPVAADVGAEELAILYAEAERAFRADQLTARPVIDHLVELLELRSTAAGLDSTTRPMLIRCLLFRAQIFHQLQQTDLVEIDLSRILEWEPGFEAEPETLPSELVRQLGRLRKSLVGELKLTAVEPPDLELHVDGRRADPAAGTLPVLAGPRWVEASRPGYAPLSEEVMITAGRETRMELLLERTSAVVLVTTRPQGADVLVDGEVRGTTGGVAPEGHLSEGVTQRYRREEFSAPLTVSEIEPGVRVLEIRKPGYRPYRLELELLQPLDYPIPPVVLEEQRGTLVLKELPPGASILINGEPRRPDNPGSPSPRIDLPPGEHLLQISESATRMFTTRFRLADRQTTEVWVRLRPGLALLGVLGEDPRRASDLEQALRLGLSDSGKWTVLDRRADAAAALSREGVTTAALRRGEGIDWAAIQKAVDDRAPGLLYLLGVLSDDLLASHADIWIWPAAPGPARPDRVRIGLGDGSEIARLRGLLDRSVPLERAWLGAVVVDSDAVPHPLVADVTPGGPAAQAGIEVGDQILAISGVQVGSRDAVEQRLAVSEIGERVEVDVRSAAGDRKLRLELRSSPLVHEGPAAEELESVAFTELLLREEEATPESLWVIRLNLALVLMRARDWEGTVRRLRDIRAPQVPYGVGQAAVDYWLGVALVSLGPTYRSGAIEALQRAARVDGGRLFHHDGPFVAPRARARLEALGPAQK